MPQRMLPLLRRQKPLPKEQLLAAVPQVTNMAPYQIIKTYHLHLNKIGTTSIGSNIISTASITSTSISTRIIKEDHPSLTSSIVPIVMAMARIAMAPEMVARTTTSNGLQRSHHLRRRQGMRKTHDLEGIAEEEVTRKRLINSSIIHIRLNSSSTITPHRWMN